jgi:D-alanyl-lipoteichoic acid acyltransferase DltB (MBOAT superfamily)
MTLGLFEKAVLADGFLAPVVEKVYDGKAVPGFVDSWLATLGFSAQIFCDFAGYSITAIGAALCLGFALSDNFRFPYAAIGFTDFWRRWHITLWLRDYVYIPLGGNRHGDARTYFSLMATMLIGGLWHGASWTFVIWGGLHGLYALFDRACLLLCVNHNGVSHGRSSRFFLFCCSTPGTFISMMLDQVRAVRLPVEHFSRYRWSGARWARSQSVGEVPRRWVKTRVRAVALAYPTAVAMSLSELPLRSIVWAMPRRQLVR